MRDLDRRRIQGFVDWLTTKPGRRGRLKRPLDRRRQEVPDKWRPLFNLLAMTGRGISMLANACAPGVMPRKRLRANACADTVAAAAHDA
jgi:hypothetical protein